MNTLEKEKYLAEEKDKYFAENAPQEQLGRQSVRGGAISIFGRGVMALVQIGSVLFLARMLSPEDYGLVAMVMSVTGFAPILVDLGTRDAVVQRFRITEGEVSALFWLTVGVGCVFAALVAASGPLIARFYHEPKLSAIALASSLTFVLTGLTNQHQALLRRAVKFRELATIEVIANFISAVIAVVMAYYGFGYWALVTRPVAMYAFIAAGVWLSCRWLPGKPIFTAVVKEMIRFGVHLTGFSFTEFLGKNSPRIAIGRGLGPQILGYYQNALFVYDNLLDVVVYPLHQVAIATLSKLQSQPAQLRESWGKALSTVAFYAMPVFGMLAVTSQDVITLMLGKRWANAGVILSVLALRGIPHSVERTMGWLHVAAGRTDRWMRWGVFSMVAQLLALVCGLPFGTIGVAAAYVLCMFLLFIPAITYAGQPFEISARNVIRVIGRPLTGSLLSVAFGFALRYSVLADTQGLPRAICIGAAYWTVYLVIVVGVLKVRTPLRVIESLVRDFVPARFLRFAENRS